MLSWLLKQIISGFLLGLRLNGLSSRKRKQGIICFIIFMQTKRKRRKLKVIFEVLTLICDALVINDWPVNILEQNIEFFFFFICLQGQQVNFCLYYFIIFFV